MISIIKNTAVIGKIFEGKDALIIGGTGGIGRETALLLAETGARITLHGGSSRERLERTLEEIRAAGAEADAFLCPIESEDSLERVFSEYSIRRARTSYMERRDRAISGTRNTPDILIYAYGPFKRAPLAGTDDADWRFLTLHNLALPGAAVSRVLPAMAARRFGRILLFGGTNTDTVRGFTTTAAYSAAKTALGVVAKSAAKSAAGAGVTCNVICPGLTDTEYADASIQAYNRDKSPEGKAISPKAVALTALYVLANRSINGAVIPVDGGVTV